MGAYYGTGLYGAGLYGAGMPFPEEPLEVHCEIDPLGTGWIDITDRVREDKGINGIFGQSGEGSQTQASQFSLTLDNTDEALTPGEPESPWYPYFGRNTPIRLWVEQPLTYLPCPDTVGSYASTADHASLDITGDLDVAIDATLSTWCDSMDLLGKYGDTAGQRSWVLYNNAVTRRLRLRWYYDASNYIEVSATRYTPRPAGHRMAVRATLDVNNGAGGYTVTFYTAGTIAGPWTQFGDEIVTTSGTTAIHAGSSRLYVGAAGPLSTALPCGRIHAAEVRSGIGGTVVASPDFTGLVRGDTSFTDSAGRPWTITGTEAADSSPLFAGEISDVTSDADQGNKDKTVSIVASGILRRMQQGAKPVQSSLRKSLPTADGLRAYWPCEVGDGSSLIGSASSGTRAMVVSGAINMASYSGFRGSSAIPTVGTARTLGYVPNHTSTGEVSFRFLVNFPASGMADGDLVARLYTTGTLSRVDLQWITGGGLRLLGYDSEGTLTKTGTTVAFGAVDVTWRLGVDLTQNGADVDWVINAITPGANAGQYSSTFTSVTVGRCTKIAMNPGGTCAEDMAFGHVTVQDTVTSLFDFTDELNAWAGESAAGRIERLCLENNITYFGRFGVEPSQAMGHQGIATLMTLLRECEKTDGGILYESRDRLGLAYVSRPALSGQPVDCELNYPSNELSAQPFPSFDDSLIRNEVTCTRTNGASAVAVDEETLLSVLPPPDGIGRYDAEEDLNVQLDDDLEDHASWRLTHGTVQGARFPRIQVNRARGQISGDAALDQAVRDLDVGDRIVVTDPASWISREDIDVLVVGGAVQISNFEHSITWNCQPAAPWKVAEIGGDDRIDSDDTVLDENLDTTETGVTVENANGTQWTTDVGDFPFDLMVGGERMTATACSGTGTSQTFTVTRSVNGVVKAHSTGAKVSLADPVYHGIGIRE